MWDALFMWTAVVRRDRRADGLFVYAVTSTGIYCRPSCPSRRPRRDRVEFFPAPDMARAAGYRACRRCQPDAPAGPDAAADRLRRACRAIAARPEARWTTAAIARAGGASIAQLQRAFRARLHVTPREYVAACRHRRFLANLRKERSVTDAIYAAGFGSTSRVYGAVQLAGMTPATYARGGRGASIRWITTPSPLGTIVVAATPRGICFVHVIEAGVDPLDALREEFPEADLAPRASADLAPLAAAALAVASAAPVPADVPLDIRGTAFQWRVWQALTRIPRGETRTYSEVAAEIGQPTAVRAVAHACATNPVSLLIPCHRVLRRDRSLGGYRWGLATKRKILEIEN